MQKIFFIVGALLAFLGVASGAFGAHALKQRFSSEMLNVFEVGVRYQMYHALALIAVALVYTHHSNSLITASGWSMITGTIIFSGSLYILALSGIRAWGAVTPIGGVILLLAWLLFILGVLK